MAEKEYIEREAAIDCLHFVCVPQCRQYAQEEIKKLPAADVRSTECCEECRDALLKTIDHYKQLCADVRPVVRGKWEDVEVQYDELVKKIRHCATDPMHCLSCGEVKDGRCFKRLMTQAADAIEELNKPKWIPVTERLPESGERVLACCRVKWLGGGGRTYVCAAFHSAPKTETCVYSDGIDMEYDEETDEYYLPEGWWEVINNWDDYSFVAIGDFVTHWMPLPQPPKEES